MFSPQEAGKHRPTHTLVATGERVKLIEEKPRGWKLVLILSGPLAGARCSVQGALAPIAASSDGRVQLRPVSREAMERALRASREPPNLSEPVSGSVLSEEKRLSALRAQSILSSRHVGRRPTAGGPHSDGGSEGERAVGAARSAAGGASRSSAACSLAAACSSPSGTPRGASTAVAQRVALSNAASICRTLALAHATPCLARRSASCARRTSASASSRMPKCACCSRRSAGRPCAHRRLSSRAPAHQRAGERQQACAGKTRWRKNE